MWKQQSGQVLHVFDYQKEDEAGRDRKNESSWTRYSIIAGVAFPVTFHIIRRKGSRKEAT